MICTVSAGVIVDGTLTVLGRGTGIFFTVVDRKGLIAGRVIFVADFVRGLVRDGVRVTWREALGCITLAAGAAACGGGGRSSAVTEDCFDGAFSAAAGGVGDDTRDWRSAGTRLWLAMIVKATISTDTPPLATPRMTLQATALLPQVPRRHQLHVFRQAEQFPPPLSCRHEGWRLSFGDSC